LIFRGFVAFWGEIGRGQQNSRDSKRVAAMSRHCAKERSQINSTLRRRLVVVFVAPAPVVALFVLVQRVVFAIGPMIRVVVRVIDDDFMIVPAVIVVMIVVVVRNARLAARDGEGETQTCSENEETRKIPQRAHRVKPPFASL